MAGSQIELIQQEAGGAAETPSKQATAAADAVYRYKDANGRDLACKKPSILQRLKLFELLGPEGSKIEALVNVGFCAFCVVEIDGEALRKPATRRELDALIARLDDAGIEATNAEIEKQFGDATAGAPEKNG